jgi:superfamily II DNA or RNA helicase
VTERAAVRRDTVTPRAEAAAARINGEPDERWIAWYGRLDEAAAVAERVPGAVIVQGKDSAERKELVLRDFAEGRLRVLVTHCDVAGFGMNFQACARQVFVGLSDSYEAYYQAIRRSWRFGQTRPVHAHIVLSEPERAVYDNVLRKEAEAGELTRELVAAMRDFERAELGISKQDTEDRYAPTRPLVLPAWLRSEETQEGAHICT